MRQLVDKKSPNLMIFTALPGGGLGILPFSSLPEYFSIWYWAIFWSATTVNVDEAYGIRLISDGDEIRISELPKYSGLSVRCVKD